MLFFSMNKTRAIVFAFVAIGFLQLHSSAPKLIPSPLYQNPNITNTIVPSTVVPSVVVNTLANTTSGVSSSSPLSSIVSSTLRAGAGVGACLAIVYGLKFLKDYLESQPDTAAMVKDFKDDCQLWTKTSPSANNGERTGKQLLPFARALLSFTALHVANILLFDLPLLAITSSISPYLKWAFIAGDLWFSWVKRVKPIVDSYYEIKAANKSLNDLKLEKGIESILNAATAMKKVPDHFVEMKNFFDATYGKLGLRQHPLIPKQQSLYANTMQALKNLLFN